MDKNNKRELFEERLLQYSKNIYDLIQKLPKDKVTIEYFDQLNRCSCSVGANYIEANEAESRKDFFHRIKISRKEAKESRYWLNLILHSFPSLVSSIQPLIQEATEYVRIFSATLKFENVKLNAK